MNASSVTSGNSAVHNTSVGRTAAAVGASPIQSSVKSVADTSVSTGGHKQDRVDISAEGRLAAEGYNKQGIKLTEQQDGSYDIRFKNTAFVYDAILRGSVEIEGKEIVLDENVKGQLKKSAERVNAKQEKLMLAANALHNAHVYEQQTKAMMEQSKKDLQAYSIATRMSKGNIVSPKEESMLLKSDPELYLMAKLAQHMAEMHEKDERLLKKEDAEKATGEENWESPLNHLPQIYTDGNISVNDGEISLNSIQETIAEH